ncbi:MAG: NADH-quinone oxidoreductase subunit C [Candidatus Thiodiazotropha sp.]
MSLSDLYKRLKRQFQMGELTEQRPDLGFVTLSAEHLRSLLVHLRDAEGFTHLVLLTAVDWLEEGQFQLTYLLSNREKGCDLGMRVMIERPADALVSMESIHDLWPTAETYQRELFDTMKFAEENFKQRPGRETWDPAHYMKQQLYPDSN